VSNGIFKQNRTVTADFFPEKKMEIYVNN